MTEPELTDEELYEGLRRPTAPPAARTLPQGSTIEDALAQRALDEGDPSPSE